VPDIDLEPFSFDRAQRARALDSGAEV